MPPTTRHLGTAIRQAREAREISIEALAAAAGISWEYLSSIERGAERQNPTWVVLGKLSSGLDLEISELAKRAEDVATAELD